MRERHIFSRTGKARHLTFWFASLLAVCFCPRAAAQGDAGTQTEFWPQLNIYVTINEKWQLYFLAERDREAAGKSSELHVGAYVDYRAYEKLSLRAGYFHGISFDKESDYNERRILFEQTVRLGLPAGVLLSDRNAEDLRFLSDGFSARYRNRLKLEREFAVRNFKFTPYASGEIYYDTRFHVFNRTRFTAGVVLPLPRRRMNLDLYFGRQNDSRSEPNHVNGLGVAWVINLGH